MFSWTGGYVDNVRSQLETRICLSSGLASKRFRVYPRQRLIESFFYFITNNANSVGVEGKRIPWEEYVARVTFRFIER